MRVHLLFPTHIMLLLEGQAHAPKWIINGLSLPLLGLASRLLRARNFAERRLGPDHSQYLPSRHPGEAFSTVPLRPKLGHIVQTVNATGLAYATCGALQQLVARQCRGRGFGIVYCLRTADKAPDTNTEVFIFLRYLQEKRRADERTRTADLLITSDRSRVVGVCTRLQFPHF